MDFARLSGLVAAHGTPALFLSQSRLRESFRTLALSLPGVELFYAVKSNAQTEIIDVLRQEGSSFDICTNGEIDIVRNCGVPADRCMHTHPIKRDSDIC